MKYRQLSGKKGWPMPGRRQLSESPRDILDFSSTQAKILLGVTELIKKGVKAGGLIHQYC